MGYSWNDNLTKLFSFCRLARLQWTEISWSENEMCFTSENCNSHSFRSDRVEFKMARSQSQAPTEYKTVPVFQGQGQLGVSQRNELNVNPHSSPSPTSPPSLPSTWSLTEKTQFADVITKLYHIWLTCGLSQVSWVQEKIMSQLRFPILLLGETWKGHVKMEGEETDF